MCETQDSSAEFKISTPVSTISKKFADIMQRFESKFEQSKIEWIRTGDSLAFFVCSVLKSDLEEALVFFENEKTVDVFS